MKLLYPTSLQFDPSLLEGFSVSLHAYDVKSPIPESLIDAEILITWSNSSSNLQDAASRMKQLRWIQSLAAGPNDVFNAGFDTSRITVTTGSGLHDGPVAEHGLGLMLNAARRFYEMRECQLRHEWASHLGGSQPDRPEGRFTTLKDARVTIWGFGNIAKALTPLLQGLGATVTGVARSKGVRNGVEVVTDKELPDLLARTDALVMILPGSESTNKALDAKLMDCLPSHAWVFNLGRGTTIDEEALYEHLKEKKLGGAGLDVFDTEPLPKESPLWETPNCIVSPHAAGGRPQGAEDFVAYNLRRFLAGQELRNKI